MTARKTLTFAPNSWRNFHFDLVGRNVSICIETPSSEVINWRLLETAGQMIACWTSSTEFNRASNLLRGLSQALYFFWSGCRDDEQLMSIVKFTACLEALSPNRKFSGVLNLLKSRLGIQENDSITNDKTLKQMVKLIYKHARSRTLHGTNAELLHDWSIVQTNAEIIARHCIVSSMHFLIENPDENELSCLSNE